MTNEQNSTDRPTFQFNFYGSVGQNIAHVDCMEVHFDKDMTMQVVDVDESHVHGEAEVPECLRTEAAKKLWEKAVAQGWVDEQWQPLLSRPLAALLADRMAEVLGIAAKWKVFEQLWRRKNIRNDYNTALEQQQCDEYMKKFKRIIT